MLLDETVIIVLSETDFRTAYSTVSSRALLLSAGYFLQCLDSVFFILICRIDLQRLFTTFNSQWYIACLFITVGKAIIDIKGIGVKFGVELKNLDSFSNFV